MSRVHTYIARSASEMDRVASLWNHLLDLQTHSIFQRFTWNRLAAEMFSDRLTPHVVCAESDRGAAIIPAVINHRDDRIELIGETLFDYRDFLHAGEQRPLLHAWHQLAALDKPLQVTAIDQSTAQHRWNQFPTTVFASAPQVDHNNLDSLAFRLSHPRLGRQMRRLQKRGVEHRRYSGNDSAAVGSLYGRKGSNFTVNTSFNIFADDRRREFMVEAARLEADDCRIYTLEQAENLVAGIVTFRDGETRRFYTTYFSPEWAHYSPGQALLYEATARTLEEDLSSDYMTGEYPYKLRLANSSRPLFCANVSSRELADVATHATAA